MLYISYYFYTLYILREFYNQLSSHNSLAKNRGCNNIFHRFWDLNIFFRNEQHAKSLKWYDEERIEDGKLRHLADSLAWERVDKMWSKIGDDPRNLRLGLSVDGINPHSSLSSKYSCWPIALAIYNLLGCIWSENSQWWHY